MHRIIALEKRQVNKKLTLFIKKDTYSSRVIEECFMKRAVSIVIVVIFVAGLVLLSGCGPSAKELLAQKTKENQELQTKVTELEKEVQKLQGELSTCQEDFRNLLYYNREKDKETPSR
jgi:outer membrane murein-binding lipoprotein Lpp